MKTAPISKIVHSSVHDGPGIRTVIFFAGCPLSCQWCHNPESMSASGSILYFEEKCLRCGACLQFSDCFSETGKAIHPTVSKCGTCKKCIDACLGDALQLSAQSITIAEVLEEIEQDLSFYSYSGGGITASGGECLLYSEFLAELFSICKAKGIHTCIESAMYVPFESVQQIAPLTDLFLTDIKLIDPLAHKQYTGKDNALILENISRLFKIHSNIRIRIPLIPGITDTEENLLGIAEFVQKHSGNKSAEIELLPYNGMAKNKYDALRREYRDFGERQSKEQLENILSRMIKKHTLK